MTSTLPHATETAPDAADTVAVIGAGSIGIAWAVVFACAGIQVRCSRGRGGTRVGAGRDRAEARGPGGRRADRRADRRGARAGGVWDTLEDALAAPASCRSAWSRTWRSSASCSPTSTGLTTRDVVLASSTSTIMASLFADGLPGRERCLVVHPANPPYFLRVAEIVPAAFTSPEAIAATRALLVRADIAPIALEREIEGFALNRLQGALLREAYCLVRDGDRRAPPTSTPWCATAWATVVAHRPVHDQRAQHARRAPAAR